MFTLAYDSTQPRRTGCLGVDRGFARVMGGGSHEHFSKMNNAETMGMPTQRFLARFYFSPEKTTSLRKFRHKNACRTGSWKAELRHGSFGFWSWSGGWGNGSGVVAFSEGMSSNGKSIDN